MSWSQLRVRIPGDIRVRRAEFHMDDYNQPRNLSTLKLAIKVPGWMRTESVINFDWDAIVSFNWEAGQALKRLGIKIPDYFETYPYFKEDPTDPRVGYRRPWTKTS